MGASKFRHLKLVALILAFVAAPSLHAQDEEFTEETGEPPKAAEKSAGRAERAHDPSKTLYTLELFNVRDYKTVALVQKQLENLLERGAGIQKTRSTWGQLTYELRTSMGSGEIRNGLMQMQLEEARLKSVSFANNRFTVEVQ